MLNRKLAGGLSARSVAYLRVVLRAALNQARKWNLVARNVAKLVDPPKFERFKIERLSPEEARALLEAARGGRLEALYAVTFRGVAGARFLAYAGGMSTSNMVALPCRMRCNARRVLAVLCSQTQDRSFTAHDRAARTARGYAQGSPRAADRRRAGRRVAMVR